MLTKTKLLLFSACLPYVWVVSATLAQTGTPTTTSTTTSASPTKTEVDPKSECKLSGLVVKLAGSEPIRGATVQLQSEEEASRSVTARTTADGRFALKAISPGRYRLRVSRNGFVMQEYGQRKPEDPGSVLTLRAGQEVNDLLFRLIASAVISGRVLNESGEPQPWVQVSAVRQAYSDGKRTLVSEGGFTTNDLGEYRLFGLRPGRYFVSAMALPNEELSGERQRSSQDSTAGEEGYGKTYYPGTPDPAKATPLTLKAGDEIPSIDIFLRSVSVYRIRGRVYNDILHRPGATANVFLTPRARENEWEAFKSADNIKPDGSFEIAGVLPGAYNVIAFWSDEGKQYSASVAVDVGAADAEGVQLSIGPGVNVNGRVLWDGTPSLEKEDLSLQLLPKNQTMMLFGSNDGDRVKQNGQFTIQNVSEGTYEATTDGQSKDCYLKDLRYGDTSVIQNGFTVARGSPASLEITISSRGARAQGTVTNSDNLPAAGVWVVLIPEPPDRSQSRLYKQQSTDQYGHFDFHGIAPGSYKLFSWDQVEQGAWQDPEFLKPFEDKGEKLIFKELEQKNVSLTTIASPEAQQMGKP